MNIWPIYMCHLNRCKTEQKTLTHAEIYLCIKVLVKILIEIIKNKNKTRQKNPNNVVKLVKYFG